MAFEVVQKPAFYHDLVSLPRDVQKRVPAAVRHIALDPIRANGNAKRCFKHLYKNLYRYRIGDYRLVYSVGDGCVCLLSVGPRDEIYDRFHLDPRTELPSGVDASSAEPQVVPTTVYDTFDSPEIGREGGEPFAAVLEGPEADGAPAVGAPASSTGSPARWLLEELMEHWGIAGEYRRAILGCPSLEALLELDIPDDVKERVLHWQSPPNLDEILEQPTMELRDPDDLDRYVEGSLKRFLLKLDPDQERAAARALRGPVLVKGGPGTGKSLVALYRIKNLLERPAQHQLFAPQRPRILFLTYTRSLINVCQELLEELLGEIPEELHVMTLDRKVREIVTAAGKPFRPAGKDDKERALQRALEGFPPPGGLLQRMALRNAIRSLRPDYILEEFDWVIEGRALHSLDAYLAEERAGRGIRLDKGMRQALWELHQRYLANLRAAGFGTWDLYRQQAEQLLRAQMPDGRYDVVIIDEAQDLTPAGLRVCVALARQPEGLYLTADASQSIYNRGFAWNRVHGDLRVRGRSLVLKRNYRTTQEIAEAAAQLLRGRGGDDEVLHVDAVRQGPKPVLVPCRDARHEIQVVAGYLREAAKSTRMPVGSGAVLVRNHRDAAEVADGLTAAGVPARHVKGDEVTLETRHVRVMTIHTAKGLEFPFVAVARVDGGILPRIPPDLGPEEAEQRVVSERRLLFVALSRAMRRLLVTYNQGNPSPFIAELDPGLWDLRTGAEAAYGARGAGGGSAGWGPGQA